MKNEGTITGKIVGMFSISPTITAVRIITKTVAEKTREFIGDAPIIIFHNEAVPNITSFKRGDHVVVAVHLSTRRTFDKDGNKKYFFDVIGDKISTYASMNDVNIIRLEAPVTHIHKTSKESVVFCTLAVEHNGVKNYPSICCYGKIADVLVNEIKVGDVVQMKCSVQTTRKVSEDGKTHTTQSVICQAISK